MTPDEALPAASSVSPPPSQASPSSQDGDVVDGAQGDLVRKIEEVDQLLVKLKNAGKEIELEMARIRAEATRARDAIAEVRRRDKICWCSIMPDVVIGGLAVFTFASAIYYLGWRSYEEALRMECGGFYGIASNLNRLFDGKKSF